MLSALALAAVLTVVIRQDGGGSADPHPTVATNGHRSAPDLLHVRRGRPAAGEHPAVAGCRSR